MVYTLDYCDKYLDEKLDKMGSDYFPLPIKFNRFIQATYDFIRETSEFLEGTQEISDDIKPLITSEFLELLQVGETNIWECNQPSNYLRLISLNPFFKKNKNQVTSLVNYDNLDFKYKKVSIIKLGQYDSYKRDPFRKPTHEYPLVLRTKNKFKFDFGFNDVNYTTADILYVKEPLFADVNILTDVIVDLPNITIEKILDRTASSLRMTTGDPGGASNYNFDQTFGKRNK